MHGDIHGTTAGYEVGIFTTEETTTSEIFVPLALSGRAFVG